MPKISVIVIFYNAEKYFAEAIESVVGQTSSDWELLLVDDGSQDGSTRIARDYVTRHPDKIRYLAHAGHQNRGMSATRNLGLCHARGEYVAFLDSDDVWLPEKLERQSAILDHHSEVGMVYGPTLYWYTWDRVNPITTEDQIGMLGVSPNQVILPPELSTLYLKDTAYIPCMCALMVRKSAIQQVGGFEEHFKGMYEDQVFFAKMTLHFPVFVMGDVLDKYRQHRDSACYQAEKAGEYNPAGTNRAEGKYLRWLVKHLKSHHIKNPDLCKALEKKILLYRWSPSAWLRAVVTGFVKKWSGPARQIRNRSNSFLRRCKQSIVWRTSGVRQFFKNVFPVPSKIETMSFQKKIHQAVSRQNVRGLILMYHRVINPAADPWHLAVSPENFEEQMRVLKAHGVACRLSDMSSRLGRRSYGQPEIVVTFDDGYADNFYHAAPILERQGVPATFFVVSGDVDQKTGFWWDRLECAILRSQSIPGDFRMEINHQWYEWSVLSGDLPGSVSDQARVPENGSALSRLNFYFTLWKILFSLSREIREDVLKSILSWSGSDVTLSPMDLAMTSQNVASLGKSGFFEIGAHTVHHASLAALAEDVQNDEVFSSRKALENITGQRIVSFSYPFGHYSAETARIVQGAGFMNACTVQEKLVARNADRYQLPRFMVMNWTGDELERQLLSWLGSREIT